MKHAAVCSRDCTAVLAVDYHQWVFCSAYQSHHDSVLSLSCLYIWCLPLHVCARNQPQANHCMNDSEQKKTLAFIWPLKLIKWAWSSHFASLDWLKALHNLLNWKQETFRGAGAQNFKRGNGSIFKPILLIKTPLLASMQTFWAHRKKLEKLLLLYSLYSIAII